MERYKSENRTQSLERLIPDLYNYKTVLYIGARSDRFDYGKEFKEAGYRITIVEAWEDNVDYLRTMGYDVIHADVREYKPTQKFDIVFWWHGPEHVDVKDLGEVLDTLESVAIKAVVLGCPWGDRPQGALYHNPFERHASSLNFPFFEERGYKVECIGRRKNDTFNNLTAVKYV